MSLIAWYPLNGNLKDNCGGPDIEKGIKITETTTGMIEPTWGDGKLGKCYKLNSNSIYTNNSEIFIPKLINKKVMSISCWLKQEANSALFADWLSFGVKHFNQDFNGYRFRLEAGSTGVTFPKFFGNGILTNSGGIISPCANESISLGTWIHIVYVFNGKGGATYLNGKSIGYTPYSWPGYEDVVFTGGFILGGGNAGKSPDTNVLNGGISNVKIYDHVLSQEEILQDYKQPILHYTFENPYAEPTVNISHSLIKHPNHTHVTLGSDTNGTYFTKTTDGHWYEGLEINNVPVVGGRYYTWSIDVNPNQDISLSFDSNATFPTSNGSNDYGITVTDSSYSRGNTIVPANTWTRIWQTIYVYSGAGKGVVWSTLCTPSSLTLDSTLKVYYRNSLFEEKNHPTPYVSSSREAGLIRDNSGMGNDGTIVYQREELALTDCISNHYGCTITKSGSSYIINNFTVVDNLNLTLAKIDYNSRYCYLNSLWSFEFDIKLENMTYDDTLTKIIRVQGPIYKKDGSLLLTNNNTWYTGNPINFTEILTRVKNGTNGTYHITIQKSFTNEETCKASNNIDYYCFGLRFDAITAGTVTISNLHAYYQNLDTSTLSITDNSAVGTHSAYFNGKNYIDCGLVTPQDIDALTLSCWAYKDDWTTLGNGNPIDSALISSVNYGGFGFKVEPCVAEKLNTAINFVIYYKDKGYLEHITSKGLCIDYSKLSKGWHLITGTADRNKATLYLDGKKVKEITHNLNKPIYNYDTENKKRTNLLVGAEPEAITGKLTVVGVYIDDVRLYPIALSAEDIKALYNVKTKIDNKSNLYCNQLVETKSENLASDLSEITDIGNLRCTCSVSYDKNNKILTFTATNDSTEPYAGPYILNKYYGGSLVTNKTYRYSIYVKFSRSGRWKVGEERIINSSSSPFKNGQEYEAGKWYKIENEGVATAAQVNFIFYSQNQIMKAGDKIQIRDFQMYRLYDDENYNPGPNIKGQYKTFELNETFNEDIENSGATIVDKYGAEWLEVFYHNNKSGTILFANEQEALHTNSQYKFSILDQLESFRGVDNKFEFLLEYPTDLPNQYLRWKQSDNPAETTDTSSELYEPTSFVNGYELIHTNWNDTDNQWSGLILTNKGYSILDGVIGTNWWYAIGSCQSYTELGVTGVPGPKQGTQGIVIPNDTHLYVRIDNLENKNEIFRQYKRQTKTKEIIEI